MTDVAYEPGPFIGVFNANRQLAELLWRILNSPESTARLKMATELKQPAIVAVERPLRELLGDAIDDDGIKRMIGHMLRQVMTRLGFELEKTGVKLRDFRDDADKEKERLRSLFSVGARYRRRQLIDNEENLVALTAGDRQMADEIRRNAATARAEVAGEKARK